MATAKVLRESSEIPTYSAGEEAISMIKYYEGFCAEPYNDSGHQTIGYGTQYSKAQAKWPGCTSITEEQAEELLLEDLAEFETYLNNFLVSNSIVVNQNQFDALLDLTYNVGTTWFTYVNDDGTWCKLKVLLLSDPSTWTEEAVQEAFGTWVKSGGVVLEGLVKRRAAEAELFMTPVEEKEAENYAFSDVTDPTAWYYDWVNSAYEAGIINGMGDGTFCPDDSLTRGQMVQMLAKLAGADLDAFSGSSFVDVDAAAWYAPAVAWATENGIVQGYGDGRFGPEDEISRQHMCNILARYLRSVGITGTEEVAAFADDELMEEDARENIYFCAGLGMVEGVGDNYFAPKDKATRAQAAKLLVEMMSLIEAAQD